MCVLSNSGERICPSPNEQGGVDFTITDPDGPANGGQLVVSMNDRQLHRLLSQVKEIDEASHQPSWSWDTPR